MCYTYCKIKLDEVFKMHWRNIATKHVNSHVFFLTFIC